MSAIGSTYYKTFWNASTGMDSFIAGHGPCYYGASTSMPVYSSISGGQWSHGVANTPSDPSWSNSTPISNVATIFRPISLGIRLRVRFPSTTNPPILFGGCLPWGVNLDITKVGSTALTVPAATLSAPTTSDVPGYHVTAVWTPSDSLDVTQFTAGWNGVIATVLPYVGFVGTTATASSWSLELEAISFFEYQQQYSDIGYTVTHEDNVRYTAMELYDQLGKIGFANPGVNLSANWASVHKKAAMRGAGPSDVRLVGPAAESALESKAMLTTNDSSGPSYFGSEGSVEYVEVDNKGHLETKESSVGKSEMGIGRLITTGAALAAGYILTRPQPRLRAWEHPHYVPAEQPNV